MSIMENEKGFTLIELLVVISIISLLSSVVFTVLNGAKSKAKDASVKAELGEFEKLLILEYADKGSYCELIPSPGGGGSSINMTDVPHTSCSSVGFLGSYASQAVKICDNLWGNIKKDIANRGTLEFDDNYPQGCDKQYSVSVSLNNGKFYCLGNKGKGEYDNILNSSFLGCPNNLDNQ